MATKTFTATRISRNARLFGLGALACIAATLLTTHAPYRPFHTAATTPPASTTVLHGVYAEVHGTARKGAPAGSESAPEQWLRTADGKAYRLRFSSQPNLQSQTTVRVEGTVRGNQVAVASASSTPTTSAVATTISGTRSVLIMMVNWTRPDATTPAAAQRQVGVTDNSWYSKVSTHRLAITARATSWMTVPKSDCTLATGGYWKLLTAAENAAKAHGYNPAAYNHEMVYFPYDAKCTYGGLGSVNARASWVNGEMDSRVTLHELGHNLGLNHSRSAVCVDSAGRQVAMSGKCTIDQYGDLFDTMGVPATGTPEFNAIQLNHLGWLKGHNTTVTTTRTVTLSALENGINIVAARILVGGKTYWLEYRRPIGVDSTLSSSPGSVDGLLVHHLNGADGGTDLLDMRPDATKSFRNAALRAGSTWRSTSFTVKVKSATASQAVVAITVP